MVEPFTILQVCSKNDSGNYEFKILFKKTIKLIHLFPLYF